jgi:hypothetical protein
MEMMKIILQMRTPDPVFFTTAAVFAPDRNDIRVTNVSLVSPRGTETRGAA